ncbi:MAG: ATP-binding cassette domain-containing protein [Clostridiales bacterium]|jgi:predicted ATPase|uniref:AAA family ATPase n=1 Tax=Aminipila sp. TaxID=2060095 RepID=UPI001D91A3E3|nr:AAA family ATPase [Aminipila sp.]MBE6033895.1 ATP-binding cassette domain-containing protein [Clostridiales bacterium]
MLYLDNFTFPDHEQEVSFFMSIKRTCYTSYYPFQILSQKELRRLDCEPITILYGGNGSGKTTVLNIIAEKLKLKREAAFNHSSFFEEYVSMCSAEFQEEPPKDSRIITSDDVFDFMLNIRTLNEGIDTKRDVLFDEYLESKYSEFTFQSLADYDQLKRVNLAKSKSQSKFVKKLLMNNIRERSNGESAFMYFTDRIKENALYLLDEPENSLSAKRQLELVNFLEDSARFFNCQFVISTHSPFLLSLKGAKIYDMDEIPVTIKSWTKLETIQVFYNFFKEHEKEF